MILETLDGIAERPGGLLILRAIARRIVAGGVSCSPIRHQLDHGCAETPARAHRSPARGGVDSEEVIAVDTQPGQTVRRPASCERWPGAAGDALERRDRPLVVDDVDD